MDNRNVEALVVLKGVEPFATDVALVHHQGPFAVRLGSPWVHLQVEEKGRERLGVLPWPQPGFRHEKEHGVLGV